jgi:hypothetical protein
MGKTNIGRKIFDLISYSGTYEYFLPVLITGSEALNSLNFAGSGSVIKGSGCRGVLYSLSRCLQKINFFNPTADEPE